jgi:ribonuclease VapC
LSEVVIVLDASAVLALLQVEPGAAAVQEALPGALLSTVNMAEVVTKLAEGGVDAARARSGIDALRVQYVPLDAATAEDAGALRPVTRKAGLSLGDRCCLALARQHRAVVLTTERAWPSIADAVGLEIRNVRPLQ